MSKWRVILLIAIALLILQLPGVGLFFQAANTLAHESGHAIATLLANGRVQHIHLFQNTEGVTLASLPSKWGQIITGISGYTFSSFFICVLAALWHRRRVQLILFSLFALSIVNMLFWVRNVYGLIWLIGFMTLLVFLLLVKKTPWKEGVSFILLVIMVIDSVRSAFTIALVSLLSPEQAGDASLLGQLTFAPAAVWGILFFVQALFFGALASISLLSSFKFPKKVL